MITESAILCCISDYTEPHTTGCVFLKNKKYNMIVHSDRFYEVEIIDDNGNICEFRKNSLFATSIFLKHFELSLRSTRKEKLKKLYEL